ncbi:threonine dehydrogenase-like Zn-dependent dehydrogenase [Burkholderia sp. PvR073]|uniref:hypothetical protein n=1 Tax=Burkholderia TaxID=32008 RepID=UPI00330567B4
MKAVVFHGIGDIRIDTVPDPEVAQATDAVVSVLTCREPLTNAIDAYRAFDAREPGWRKVKPTP